MNKLFLITIILVSCNSYIQSQNIVRIGSIPKFNFLSYNQGNGTAPAGFELQRLNPSVSLLISVQKKVFSKLHLGIGMNYHINRYNTKYYRDYNFPKRNVNRSLHQQSSFEPFVFIDWFDFNLFRKEGFYLSLGVTYNYTNSIKLKYSTLVLYDNTLGTKDSVWLISSSVPLKFNRLNPVISFGKLIKFKKSTSSMDLGIIYHWSPPQTLIETTIIDIEKVYKFSYFETQSYIGLLCRFNYNFQRKNSK